MKKFYEEPELEQIWFLAQDIILTSGQAEDDPNDCAEDAGGYCAEF